MEYIQYFVGLLEKTNGVNIFKCVSAVYVGWFWIFTPAVMMFTKKGSSNIRLCFSYSLFGTFLTFIVILWMDIARFYSINKIFAFIAFLALLICIIATMRAVKKRRIKKSVVVAAPPPMGKAVLGDVESEEKEKK